MLTAIQVGDLQPMAMHSQEQRNPCTMRMTDLAAAGQKGDKLLLCGCSTALAWIGCWSENITAVNNTRGRTGAATSALTRTSG